MPWIPHLMVLDDDPRVLDSLVPGFAQDLARGLGKSPTLGPALRMGEPSGPGGGGSGPVHLKVSAHGFASERLKAYRHRSPHHAHLHLVLERGGRFDLARKLLNDQLFAAVVSDLRFSDDAGGQRAGHLFVEEVGRVHPEVQGLLYSAYPRPDDFPADRFVRKGGDAATLAEQTVKAAERHLAEPAVGAFAAAIAEQGMIYQSDAFGSTLAHLFDLARLMGMDAAPKVPGRTRRPLPCVLLDGESGTGKRGLAALFHAASDRRRAPMTVASCNELTNETLLRSILFGHRRGAYTDAREDRAGLVASAGRGVVLLDDFHRLPNACSAILHSFLEDGEYSRLGEEEQRRHAEAAVILTVETAPWQERRRSGELPLAFLARVERLPLHIPPLRERPDDIDAQARWLARAVSAEVGADVELTEDAIAHLRVQPFADSNSRELRNVIERAIYRHYRETDLLEWSHLAPFVAGQETPATAVAVPPAPPQAPAPAPSIPAAPSPALNEWQRRLRTLAAKILAKGTGLTAEESKALAESLFDGVLPQAWGPIEAARAARPGGVPIPLPVWEDLWRCFAVSWLGGPSPAEKTLGIPANTLRQWINDREAR